MSDEYKDGWYLVLKRPRVDLMVGPFASQHEGQTDWVLKNPKIVGAAFPWMEFEDRYGRPGVAYYTVQDFRYKAEEPSEYGRFKIQKPNTKVHPSWLVPERMGRTTIHFTEKTIRDILHKMGQFPWPKDQYAKDRQREANAERAKENAERAGGKLADIRGLSSLAGLSGGDTPDYRGEHTAPVRDGIPLHDLTQNMPKDVYATLHHYLSPGVARSEIAESRGKPKRRVKVYRAVPYTLTTEEQIEEYQNHKRYILKTGKIPPGAEWSGTNSSAYYEFIHRQIEKLSKLPPSVEQKLAIHPGDWVALDRKYAVEHGRSHLQNKYRVLSKIVFAGDLFTDGDLEEWGWVPA